MSSDENLCNYTDVKLDGCQLVVYNMFTAITQTSIPYFYSNLYDKSHIRQDELPTETEI